MKSCDRHSNKKESHLAPWKGSRVGQWGEQPNNISWGAWNLDSTHSSIRELRGEISCFEFETGEWSWACLLGEIVLWVKWSNDRWRWCGVGFLLLMGAGCRKIILEDGKIWVSTSEDFSLNVRTGDFSLHVMFFCCCLGDLDFDENGGFISFRAIGFCCQLLNDVSPGTLLWTNFTGLVSWNFEFSGFSRNPIEFEDFLRILPPVILLFFVCFWFFFRWACCWREWWVYEFWCNRLCFQL